ncbi:MAG: OsmC family protein [Anaerolineae bacterium]|nr:OsmC family protein [Anaerolineae bacterium]
MYTSNVSARWTGEGLEFVGVDHKGREIHMGGKHIKPGQMLLLAQAGCMGMDVLSILQKKRQQVTDVEVQVTGQQPDDYPRPFETVNLKFIVKGKDIDSKAVERSIALSHDKYCVVGQSLAGNVHIETTFSIADAVPETVTEPIAE